MQSYEYKVIPAPEKGKRDRAIKSPAERFAATLAEVMNEAARDGWEYLRTDTLPSTERAGLTSSTVNYRNVMIFRRALTTAEMAETPAPEETPETAQDDAAKPDTDETGATKDKPETLKPPVTVAAP